MVDLTPLPPAQAIEYFRSKGFKPAYSWRDVWQQEHSWAFTVAKAMEIDLLSDIRTALDDAMKNGTTFKQFQTDLQPRLERRGWWGKKIVENPKTKKPEVVQLGSTRRLRIIFDTNIRMASAYGHWQRIVDTADIYPYIMYNAVRDGRTRYLHKLWNRTVLPINSPWWQTHYPPNGWRCRCSVIQMNRAKMDEMGLQLADEQALLANGTKGIDDGFQYNVGTARGKHFDKYESGIFKNLTNIAKNISAPEEAMSAYQTWFSELRAPLLIDEIINNITQTQTMAELSNYPNNFLPIARYPNTDEIVVISGKYMKKINEKHPEITLETLPLVNGILQTANKYEKNGGWLFNKKIGDEYINFYLKKTRSKHYIMQTIYKSKNNRMEGI